MGDKDVDAIGTEEATKWDPIFTEQVKNRVGPLIKRYFRAEVHGLGRHSVRRRRAVGVQPFRRDVHPRRARLRARVLPQVRLRPSRLHPRALRPFCRTALAIGCAASVSSRPIARTPRRRCAAARSCWCFPVGTTTRTGRPSRTKSTSQAGPDTSGPRSNPMCRSCRWCPSVRRNRSCSSPAATGWRSDWGCKRLRAEILPVTFGFPFGLSVFFPPNLPLPTKIVTQVLDPIDVVEEFGEDPDIDAVDAHVRKIMQTALDKLAQQAPLPDTRLDRRASSAPSPCRRC